MRSDDVPEAETPRRAPHVIVILADDMGYSDVSCYGGEIPTPAIDALAASGVRFTQFYNTARCSPSRASLLTGLHPHQTGVGILTENEAPDGYDGELNDRCATVAELLAASEYTSYLAGKWHLAADIETPNGAWPTRRGFDRFYGVLQGACSYFNPGDLLMRDETRVDDARDPDFYLTDAISDEASRLIARHVEDTPQHPFFLFVSYTAPHWPLHAPEADIARFRHHYDAGWDQLRRERRERQQELGILDDQWQLTDRDPEVPAWDDVADPDWQARRMEVYAAQVHRMDAGIGRIVQTLRDLGQLDDTLILFLSDNGGCAEELDFDLSPYSEPRTRAGAEVRFGNEPGIVPGDEGTYASYGRPWANLSNAPFREYKHWVHEGGIATPLVVHWPAGIGTDPRIRHQPFQLTDIVPTVLDAARAHYPAEVDGRPILPSEGVSMLPVMRGATAPERSLFWEHEGNGAVRSGRWKLVRKYGEPWELYDIDVDRTELHDLAAAHPDLVARLSAEYQQWAERCGVKPRDELLRARLRRATTPEAPQPADPA
ncbi:MAG TPA: arylsulfatase [Pseudolysinimonas sp.]|nr:arylsulfatase [Pseudolysinimonas sp.]